APGTDGFGDAILTIGDAARPPRFHPDALDQGAGYDGQIGPAQGRAEKAARRAPAAAALLVDVEIAAAFIIAGVEIVAAGNAGAFGGLDEGIEHPPAQARLFHAP